VKLIHGDLKPSNVLLDGTAKVSFGVSRLMIDPATGASLSDPRRVLYKPIYASPEQLLREKVDARTDVYSLGVLAYHCLSGAPPFSGTFEELRAAHAGEPAPPLNPRLIPNELGSLVLRMLEKDPNERPTIRQIRERIGSWSDRALTTLVNMPVRMTSISEQR
jgi:serine/threonine-protein kinase